MTGAIQELIIELQSLINLLKNDLGSNQGPSGYHPNIVITRPQRLPSKLIL